jgi:hypothetical protein
MFRMRLADSSSEITYLLRFALTRRAFCAAAIRAWPASLIVRFLFTTPLPPLLRRSIEFVLVPIDNALACWSRSISASISATMSGRIHIGQYTSGTPQRKACEFVTGRDSSARFHTNSSGIFLIGPLCSMTFFN